MKKKQSLRQNSIFAEFLTTEMESREIKSNYLLAATHMNRNIFYDIKKQTTLATACTPYIITCASSPFCSTTATPPTSATPCS